jgi:hypothetical protein
MIIKTLRKIGKPKNNRAITHHEQSWLLFIRKVSKGVVAHFNFREGIC